MNGYYLKNWRDYAEATFSIDPSPFLTPFLKALPAGASILDLGCGSGRDLLWFKKRGFRVTGFEKSPQLADFARKNAGCKVIEGDFEVFDFSGLSFDAVLACAAFVHVPRRRLEGTIINVSRALVRNGLFYISLKKGRGSKTDDTGRIFFLWHDRELRDIFQRSGLEVTGFSESGSAKNPEDVWLGYILRMKG